MENKENLGGDGSIIDARAVKSVEEKPTIAQFIEAISAGIKQWEKAGQILVALRRDDPDVFKRIQQEHSFITNDTLEVFHNIGTGSLYPMAVLLPRHQFRAICEMSYDKQVKICHEPVQIVTRMVGDKPVVIRKPVTKMSEAECKQALWRKGNLSVETQVRRLTETPIKTIQELLPKNTAPTPAIRVPKEVKRYAIRLAVGGVGFCFEQTTACGSHEQRILLHEGQALIVLTEWPKD